MFVCGQIELRVDEFLDEIDSGVGWTKQIATTGGRYLNENRQTGDNGNRINRHHSTALALSSRLTDIPHLRALLHSFNL